MVYDYSSPNVILNFFLCYSFELKCDIYAFILYYQYGILELICVMCHNVVESFVSWDGKKSITPQSSQILFLLFWITVVVLPYLCEQLINRQTCQIVCLLGIQLYVDLVGGEKLYVFYETRDLIYFVTSCFQRLVLVLVHLEVACVIMFLIIFHSSYMDTDSFMRVLASVTTM